MKGRAPLIGLMLAVACLATPAWSEPVLNIGLTTEKEIVVDDNGRDVVARVQAETVEPGSVLVYNVSYANDGDEKATDVVVDNPIPLDTIYVIDSATGVGSDITFSIDGGQSYKKPSLLVYDLELHDGTVEQRTASPEQYTHIRWVIEEIPAGNRGALGFRVRVR